MREGDESARSELLHRYVPIFRRWAHGRLPGYARDLAETDDLVQLSIIRALQSIDRFEGKHEGAFLAYLRAILMNLVRDEIGRAKRKPPKEELSDNVPAHDASPLQRVINCETLDAYEAALDKLPQHAREAAFLRFEFDMTYPEIAEKVRAPSANAVRMMVSRARVQIIESMNASLGVIDQ